MMNDNAYMTTGFDVEDYLVPRKPTTTANDWYEPYQRNVGISFAGGLSNPSGNQQPAASTTGLDVDLSGIAPQRQRRSIGEQAAMRAIDLFDMVSGADPKAYLGKTLANEIEYEKKLAEEDPEGYQADVNRAKVLSQRAYETNDPELKKKYGAAIKKLLPAETAGLDDLTASMYFTGNEKLEIEKLKAASRITQEHVKGQYGIQKEETKNEGREIVQEMKNMSAEKIAELRAKNTYEVAELKKMYDKEIADGKYENALQIQQMITDRHELDNMARDALEDKKQENQNFRTMYTADTSLQGRMYSADKALEGRMYSADQSLAGRQYAADRAYDAAVISANARVASANAKKGELTPEQAREQWPTIKAEFDSQQENFQEAVDLLNRYELFGPVVGRQLALGIGNANQLNALGRVKTILTEAVQKRLEQVRKAAGTGKAADSEKEAERVIGYLRGDPTIPQETILGALQQFMKTSEKAMRLREAELFGEEGAPKAESAKPALKIKSIKRIK